MNIFLKLLAMFGIFLLIASIVIYGFNNSPNANWIGGIIAGMIGIKILENE